MSLENFIHNADHHYIDIKAFDGTFDTGNRKAPYLYLTLDGPAASTTISIPMTSDTADQLRELADKADGYWDSWYEFQNPEVEEEEEAIIPEPQMDFAKMLFESFRPLPASVYGKEEKAS